MKFSIIRKFSSSVRAGFAGLVPPFAVLVLFLPSLRNGFIFDDVHMVEKNPLVCGRKIDVQVIFTSSYWGEVKEADRSAYRPITVLLHAATCQVFGPRPWAHRLVNVLLHGLCAFLLFRVYRTALLNEKLASFAALLFAVHPLNSEAVLFVSFRPESVAATCVLGAILLVEPVMFDRKLWLVLIMAALHLIAVFSKENAVVLPALVGVFAVLKAYLRGTWPLRGFLLALGPLLVVDTVYLVARYMVLGALHSATIFQFLDNPVAQADTQVRAMTALSVLARYVSLFFLPISLTADYSYAEIEPVTSPLDPLFVIGTSICLGAVVLMLTLYKRCPVAALGLCWFFIAYFPVSNIAFPIGTIMAERLFYLPMVGIILALGVAVGAVLDRVSTYLQRILQYAALAMILLLSAVTYGRSKGMKDNCTFFQRLTVEAPKSAKAHFGHGVCLLEQRDVGKAIASLDLALRIYPQYEEAAIQLAQALERAGYAEDGIARLRLFVASNPEAAKAHFSLAKMLARNQKFVEARAVLDDLIKKYPNVKLYREFRERVDALRTEKPAY